MEWIVVVVIIWLVSPIILGILTAVLSRKNRRQKEILYHLHRSGRISDADLTAAGLKLPPPPDGVQQIAPPAVQSGSTVQTILPVTESAMQAAAARAQAIAEAELNGEPVPAVLPKAAPVEPAAAAETAAEYAEEAAAECAEPEKTAETVFAAAEGSAEETAAEPETEGSAEPDTSAGTVQPPAFPYPQAVHAPVPADRIDRNAHISAISVMLSVGTALIIIAGLIFVRSAWDTMGSFGKLLTLAAGSGLFFGASALARRAWSLERTAMAFFTLGAVFLPISVWAAGCFELLGPELSGAGNPWLIALSFAAFTPIALYAAKNYKQLGWGIAAAAGAALAYYFAAGGLLKTISLPDGSRKAVGMAVFCLAAAIPAPLLAFRCEELAARLHEPMNRIPAPFAAGITAVSGILTFACFDAGKAGHRLTALYAAAFILIAAALLAPVFTERLKGLTMVPVTGYLLLGCAMLLYPLYDTVFRQYDAETGNLLRRNGDVYASAVGMTCAVLILILLLLRVLPETVRKGGLIAAFGVTAFSVFPHVTAVYDLDPGISAPVITLLTAAVLLLLTWLCAAKQKPSLPVSILIAGMSVLPVLDLVRMLWTGGSHYGDLIVSGVMLLLFGLFILTKKHRTDLSDLLFTLLSCGFAAAALGHYDKTAAEWIAAGIFVLNAVIWWTLALAHDTEKPMQYVFAWLWVPALYVAIFNIPVLREGPAVLLMTAIAAAVGFVTYFTTPVRFHTVRRTVFGTAIVPGLLLGIFSPAFLGEQWYLAELLLCTVIAAGVWRLFANRGFKKLSALSFGTALFLTLELTFLAVKERMFYGDMRFSVLMVTAAWIIALSALSAAVSKRMVLFVGSDAVVNVMDLAAPLSALVLSCGLIVLSQTEWEPFCFVFTLAVCIMAWFVTKPSRTVTPLLCACALLVSLEALRVHLHTGADSLLAVMLILMLGMTVLFPYLGIVLRESQDDPKLQHKSWSLTVFGGVIPVWLLLMLFDLSGISYSDDQRRWMVFFIPVMIAGYLLQLRKSFPGAEKDRLFKTAAAGCCMIAFWIQPVLDVKDTYFAGKLHILPLVGFGLVIRKLYGKETGGGFLFAIGCYSMLRLGIGAAVSENSADLLTVLAVALILFVASFYVKQKKWFLLGGISLVLTGIYMHMKLTQGRQWWVYLLLAGLLLIAVAAANETLKQKGDSLKTKAGRLWDDWTW